MDDWKLRLRRAREAKGLKKTNFAQLVGVSNATASDWEKSVEDGGIKELSAPSLSKIHEVLGVYIYWLLTGRGAGVAEVSGKSATAEGPAHGVEVPSDASAEETFKKVAELIDAYRLANADDRDRIDLVVRSIRRKQRAVDQAEPGAPKL